MFNYLATLKNLTVKLLHFKELTLRSQACCVTRHDLSYFWHTEYKKQEHSQSNKEIERKSQENEKNVDNTEGICSTNSENNFFSGRTRIFFIQWLWGFIKITKHQLFIMYPPSQRPLIHWPLTHKPTNCLPLTYIKIEDQIPNMFGNPYFLSFFYCKSLKTFIIFLLSKHIF